MLRTGKAVADVPFLCYRVEGMKYLAQDDENIVVLAFQCLGFGVERPKALCGGDLVLPVSTK